MVWHASASHLLCPAALVPWSEAVKGKKYLVTHTARFVVRWQVRRVLAKAPTRDGDI